MKRKAIARRWVRDLLLLASLSAHAGEAVAADGWIPFSANWTASGREHTLAMGDREASTLELSGPFVVTNGEGLSRGFRAEAIGFVERGALGVGRLVLTDERSDQIFLDLSGQSISTGRQVVGTITGGTGRYAGLEGSFRFGWRYVLRVDGTIQGRAVGLTGLYRRRSVSTSGRPDSAQ
jgi:hypothetical protein